MSTIAWDGRIGMLAADRQLTLGNSPLPVAKLFTLSKGGCSRLVACCGEYEDALLFVDWMAAGKPGTIALQDNFSALVIDRGHCWRYGQQLQGYLIDAPFWAAGSGADYAIGAMAMGANAREAVEIASQYDVFTGCGVDVEVMPVAPRSEDERRA